MSCLGVVMGRDDLDQSVMASIREQNEQEDFRPLTCDRCDTENTRHNILRGNGTWKLCLQCIFVIFRGEP